MWQLLLRIINIPTLSGRKGRHNTIDKTVYKRVVTVRARQNVDCVI